MGPIIVTIETVRFFELAARLKNARNELSIAREKGAPLAVIAGLRSAVDAAHAEFRIQYQERFASQTMPAGLSEGISPPVILDVPSNTTEKKG